MSVATSRGLLTAAIRDIVLCIIAVPNGYTFRAAREPELPRGIHGHPRHVLALVIYKRDLLLVFIFGNADFNEAVEAREDI